MYKKYDGLKQKVTIFRSNYSDRKKPKLTDMMSARDFLPDDCIAVEHIEILSLSMMMNLRP